MTESSIIASLDAMSAIEPLPITQTAPPGSTPFRRMLPRSSCPSSWRRLLEAVEQASRRSAIRGTGHGNAGRYANNRSAADHLRAQANPLAIGPGLVHRQVGDIAASSWTPRKNTGPLAARPIVVGYPRLKDRHRSPAGNPDTPQKAARSPYIRCRQRVCEPASRPARS